MEAKNDSKGADICRRWQQMKGELETWKVQWQEIADYMMPRKAGIASKYETPNDQRETLLFDTTAADGVMTMAGGLMSWTSPPNEPWFQYKPIFQLRGVDPVKQWLAGCSERIREMLADSNFYTEIHEDLLNHCCFGTSAMFIGAEDGRFRFESLPVGSFAIEENGFGVVNVLYREMHLTAPQARDIFGEDLPEEIGKMIDDPAKQNERHCFIHAVYPRPESQRPKDGIGRKAAWGKAFASCYVYEKTKAVVKEGGFDSFPFAVGRYLKWTALAKSTAYGYGPGFAALPDTRQANFLQMMLDCAAEKIVRPAMLAPDDMEGDLILSAGGITYMPGNIPVDRWPRPIAQVGDYNVAVERVKARQEAINLKFHVELFRMFTSLDRQMTAREVAERASEKITLITPAFSRLQGEKHNPILRRCFELAMELGQLEPPPPESVIPISETTGVIPDPAIMYSSRLALALDQLGMIGFERQLELDMTVAQIRPDVLDNYAFDRITRDRARANGMPVGWMLPLDEVDAIREQRAQAEQAAAMAQMMKDGSQAVKNLGGVDEAEKAMSSML